MRPSFPLMLTCVYVWVIMLHESKPALMLLHISQALGLSALQCTASVMCQVLTRCQTRPFKLSCPPMPFADSMNATEAILHYFKRAALLTMSSPEFTLGTAAISVLTSEAQMFRFLFTLGQPVLIYEPDCSPSFSQLIASVAFRFGTRAIVQPNDYETKPSSTRCVINGHCQLQRNISTAVCCGLCLAGAAETGWYAPRTSFTPT